MARNFRSAEDRMIRLADRTRELESPDSFRSALLSPRAETETVRRGLESLTEAEKKTVRKLMVF